MGQVGPDIMTVNCGSKATSDLDKVVVVVLSKGRLGPGFYPCNGWSNKHRPREVQSCTG